MRWWPHAQASGRGARRAPVASWLGALPGRRTQRRRRARPDTVARAACRQQARGPRRAALAHSHARGLHAGRAGGAVGMMTARPWHPAFRPAARKQATHIMSGRELVESRIGRCCAFDTLRLRLSFAACPLLHPQPPRCVSARADVSCRTRPGPYALASVRALCGAEFAAAGSCLDEASGKLQLPEVACNCMQLPAGVRTPAGLCTCNGPPRPCIRALHWSARFCASSHPRPHRSSPSLTALLPALWAAAASCWASA